SRLDIPVGKVADLVSSSAARGDFAIPVLRRDHENGVLLHRRFRGRNGGHVRRYGNRMRARAQQREQGDGSGDADRSRHGLSYLSAAMKSGSANNTATKFCTSRGYALRPFGIAMPPTKLDSNVILADFTLS